MWPHTHASSVVLSWPLRLIQFCAACSVCQLSLTPLSPQYVQTGRLSASYAFLGAACKPLAASNTRLKAPQAQHLLAPTPVDAVCTWQVPSFLPLWLLSILRTACSLCRSSTARLRHRHCAAATLEGPLPPRATASHRPRTRLAPVSVFAPRSGTSSRRTISPWRSLFPPGTGRCCSLVRGRLSGQARARELLPVTYMPAAVSWVARCSLERGRLPG